MASSPGPFPMRASQVDSISAKSTIHEKTASNAVRQNAFPKINAAEPVTEYSVRITMPNTMPPPGAKRLGSTNRT